MKTKILILIIIIGGAINFTNAQKIDIEKVARGYKYSQNKELLSFKDLTSIMETNTQALTLMKKGRSNRRFSGILGFTGGALIGLPLGTLIAGGNPNWTLAGIGTGLFIVAIPISSSANKKIKQAVDIHNASLNKVSSNYFNPDFKITTTSNGLGLSMSF